MTDVTPKTQREWHDGFEQLRAIRDLDEDWDDAGSEPISAAIIDSAEDIMRQLEEAGSPLLGQLGVPHNVVPSPCGSVCIEWRTNGLFVGAEIEEPYVVEWMIEVSTGKYAHKTERFEPR